MRVLQYGNKNQIVVVCDYCGSEIEYFPKDISEESIDHGRLYVEKHGYIVCPVCGEQICLYRFDSYRRFPEVDIYDY